jgi:hypothetical protein
MIFPVSPPDLWSFILLAFHGHPDQHGTVTPTHLLVEDFNGSEDFIIQSVKII